MILEALRDILLADATVTDALASYDFGDGDHPAVFTVDPIPQDSSLPAIVLTLDGGVRWGTRASIGGEADVTVRMYDDKSRSTQALRDLAWAVFEALERCTPTFDGYEEVGVMASPPMAAPDPDGFPGYQVAVLVRFLEE